MWHYYTLLRRAVFLFLLSLSFVPLAVAQTQTISGTVTSAEDNEPLPGVNILVKGTSSGTVTDVEGKYSLSVGDEAQILIFSSIGFISNEVEINGRNIINLALQPDVQSLEEIIVIGYGEQSRETLTTSISKVDNKVLENIPYANPTAALQGSVAGLRVQNTTGQPGAAPRVVLRGGTSINNPNGANPLYIVDGVIRNNLDDINPADIASIQVLKDAAATAIYGARASNGVVIVTTKSGKAGQTRVSYRYVFSASQLREKYDLASARDYIHFGRLGLAATGVKNPDRLSRLDLPVGFGIGNDLSNTTSFTPQYLTPENEYKLQEGWESMPDPLNPDQTIIFKGTDWQDVLFRTGLSHDHYVNVAGGGEKATFNASVGYLKNEGIAIFTNYERFSASLNGEMQVNDKLRAFARLNYTNSNDNEVFSTDQIFRRALALPPTAKYTFEDGTLAPGQNRSIGNPEYHLSRINAFNEESRLTLSGGFQWEVLPNLVFEPTASLYSVKANANSFQKSYYNTPTQFIDSRDASASYSDWNQSQFDAVLTYDKVLWSDHNVQAKVGLSYFNRENYNMSANGRGAASDFIPTLNASAEPTNVYSYLTQQVILGYFGRLTYDYQQKYLFSLNARYDGASNLGENYRWGFFPGVSAGWNLHREDFWDPMSNAISRLKLRASYGVNGNLGDLSDFHAQGEYQVGNIYNGFAAIQNIRMANPNLQWEESKTVDFGFDLGLLNDRISVLFDYYNRTTDNLLTDLTLPKSTGFVSILTNLGSLRNQGVEIELGANVITTNSGLSWDVSINAAHNSNEIIELPENGNENNRIGGVYVYDPSLGDYAWKGGLQEGGTIDDMYGYQQLSIYATDAEAAEGPYDELVPGTDKTKFGGDVEWLDVDQNDTIDTRDRVFMGNPYPDWTGGFTSNLSYKGLSLLVRMDYAIGHTIYNDARMRFNGQTQGDIGISTDILRSWQEQGDETDIARYYWADQLAQSNVWRGNSMYYEKGDYLALREVTLAYNLPTEWMDRIGLSNVRLYFTGSNLYYFTNYRGLSPEDGGTDSGRYPVPRNYNLGVNVSF